MIADYDPNHISGMTTHLHYLKTYFSDQNTVHLQKNATLKQIYKNNVIWFRTERGFIKYVLFCILFRKIIIYDLPSFSWIEFKANRRSWIRIYLSLFCFRLATKTAKIRVLSQLMQEYLINHFYIPKGKIFVLPIPVKIDIVHKRNRNNGKIHFIYMGSNAVWQGLSNLFKAFDQIESETDYVLECYGINHPNTKNICFHEAVSHDQLIDIVSNQIDVVVIPREKNEITETVMPLKYAEAIYLNKYILVTDMKIFHEMKNDKVVFIKNNHVDTLIEGIKSFKNIFQSEFNV